MKDVFISYKAEEADEANWVKSALETNGISCWMAPACIPGGSSYATEIPQAIKQSKVFVLILSAKAQCSQWVSKEVDLAINEGKIILPFMLENCDLKDDFNFYLTNVQRYAAYENKVAAIEKMLKEIKALVGNPDVQQAVEPIKEEININTVADKKPKPNNICFLSMVFGIIAVVAMLGVFLVPNVVAIVLSIIGADKIHKEAVNGKEYAIAGFVLGLASTVIGLSICFSVAGFIVSLLVVGISVPLFVNKLKPKTK